MSISNYGELKAMLTVELVHPRWVPQYENATILFERAANRRLRVRQMEAQTFLTTTEGQCALPQDYIAWRTVQFTGTTPYIDMDYVHPAYLLTTAAGQNPVSRIFTIRNDQFLTRPVDDTDNIYQFDYYQKIPTVVGNDGNSNWLLTAEPDVYLYGVVTELMALSRNREGAELYKARRDEEFATLIRTASFTTGATSPAARSEGGYF